VKILKRGNGLIRNFKNDFLKIFSGKSFLVSNDRM